MKRKFLAVVLSVVLALTACPFALATEADFTPAPEGTPAATESAPATDAPVVEAEPTAELVVEPTAEPAVEPTAEPVVEPTAEPVVEPTTEPTAEPEAVKAAMTANRQSVLAGSEKIELTLSVVGGKAPYSVAVTSAQGETVLSSELLTLNEAGQIVWSADAAPETGTQTLTAVVTDALGQTATAKIEMPVAEKISEDVAATVRSIDLTGDWAQDLLAIAESQIGYHESKTSFRIDESGKQHGYTRYGLWYGNAYGEWCGMFVSFCLNYAKIPEADFPREANCNKWRSALKNIAVYEDDEDNYIPAPGDLIFFDITGETDDPGHVGIVTRVDGDMIYTIEGNQGRAVREMEYKKDDKTIVGYASMAKIIARAAVKTSTDKPAETDYTAIAGRPGIMTGDKVNIRAAATKNSEALGQTGVKGETVMLIAAETVDGETWFKVEYGEIIGYIRADFVFVAAAEPTAKPTAEPTAEPTEEPTAEPTVEPTEEPTAEPTAEPTVEPTDEPAAPVVSDLYERIMACETLEEIDAIIAETPEEELRAMTEEQVAQIEAKMTELFPEPLPAIVIEESEPPVESEIYVPTVNYTKVAPFGAPVKG